MILTIYLHGIWIYILAMVMLNAFTLQIKNAATKEVAARVYLVLAITIIALGFVWPIAVTMEAIVSVFKFAQWTRKDGDS